MLRSYAQLLRLPNLFTAWADVFLGWLVVGGESDLLVAVLAASSCLYSAGMVLNDYFDAEVDARERPHRPIPSGRVPRWFAGCLGGALLLSGIAAAMFLPAHEATIGFPVGPSLAVAFALALAIVLYDAVFKATLLGPVLMGSCRFLNIVLALCSTGYWPAWRTVWPAFAVGLYIIGVTVFARREAETSRLWPLALATILMALAVALAAAAPVALQQHLGLGAILYPLGLILWGTLIGKPILDAIVEPDPRQVQRAVKTCILGLIGLDALIAFALVGWAGLLIAVLLIPAMTLGRWVYST
ncbi:MAG: UbiA family prenyltransferase [Gemmatales bacterium]|nr:UbiA family prenyltransferase [Gemmatales bacterium]MDW8387290.1 UbiA family prenyltransferase [Gemmatales bacterium]